MVHAAYIAVPRHNRDYCNRIYCEIHIVRNAYTLQELRLNAICGDCKEAASLELD